MPSRETNVRSLLKAAVLHHINYGLPGSGTLAPQHFLAHSIVLLEVAKPQNRVLKGNYFSK